MFHHCINRKTKNPNLIKVHSLLISNFLWQLNRRSPKVTHVKSCWSSFCLFALLFVCHCAHYTYIKRKTLLWNIFKSMCKAAISCKISYLSLCMLVLFYIIYISFHHLWPYSSNCNTDTYKHVSTNEFTCLCTHTYMQHTHKFIITFKLLTISHETLISINSI